MDKREVLDRFRQRLEQVIAASGLSRSAFARDVDMDRSTLSQLLSLGNERLPRLETLVAIAVARQVSIDWLLGLSQHGPLGTDVMRETLSIERGTPSGADERLLAWHAEAIGYKIRYVPTTLPDLLKTPEVIQYELARFATGSPAQAIETASARLAYQRRPETDMEACSSIQSVRAFAAGEGLWSGIDRPARVEALRQMAGLTAELYPTFRWFLYDERQRYSVPVTIFGPIRAAIYVGQMYFVFNSTQHIRVLVEHFDDLIRSAVVQPPDVAACLGDLAGRV